MITNLEICIDSCFGIDAAVEGGADRIELCSSLKYGGLTPSLEVLKLASECDIPSRSMIRPRKGNFIYSSEELKQKEERYEVAFSDLSALKVAVDQELCEFDAELNGALEVAFFPPMTGG